MTKIIAKIIQDDGRKIYVLRKEILQLIYTETLEKAKHQSLFYVFRNEGFGRRIVQSYVKKRYMETIYAQWKLQMDPAASHIELQRAQASNC